MEPRIVNPTGDSIGLMLGGELQGAYLTEGLPGTGPIYYASPYMHGWVGAGALTPEGDFVMVGLGSGAGAVGLLMAHPGVHLTVLEINPAVIRMAAQAFPILGLLEDEGRLQVVQGDAREWLETLPDTWDVGLCDAYTGAEGFQCETAYLPALLERTRATWLNVIGAPLRGPTDQVVQIAHWMALQGRPILAAYSPDPRQGATANWLLSSQPDSPDDLLGQLPYGGRAPAHLLAGYRAMMGHNRVDELRLG